jgi:hypothetical protein
VATADLTDPIGASNLAGFLQIALRTQLQMTPEEEHPEILARVASFTTRGEALAYIDDIASKLNEATESPAAVEPASPGA